MLTSSERRHLFKSSPLHREYATALTGVKPTLMR